MSDGLLAHTAALYDVAVERKRQIEKHGDQSHLPDGTSSTYVHQADAHRDITDRAFKAGRLTWRHILAEEFFEALAETEPAKLRAELVQVAAVCVAWCEAIDKRGAAEVPWCDVDECPASTCDGPHVRVTCSYGEAVVHHSDPVAHCFSLADAPPESDPVGEAHDRAFNGEVVPHD